MNEDIEGGKMDITLVCYEENTRFDKIENVIKILNGVQNYFYFCLEKRNKDICETFRFPSTESLLLILFIPEIPTSM